MNQNDFHPSMGVFNRRSLLRGAMALAATPLLAARTELKFGVTDWNLRLAGKPEAVALAAELGFAGVELSVGRDVVDGRLPLAAAELQQRYQEEFARHHIQIAGICLDILHRNCLMNDPLAAKWVADAIPIAKALGARTVLLPFFGRCEMKSPKEMDYAADALREVAPDAVRAGVLLGLENTISAEESVRMMERSKSSAVKVYYDIQNAANWGHDPVKEIRWLGADRICQFHIKDNPHLLGEGKLPLDEILRTIAELGFHGFANLETDSPSGDVAADMRRNLAFVCNRYGHV
jgi:sugar phosphate isomerase/epimerase